MIFQRGGDHSEVDHQQTGFHNQLIQQPGSRSQLIASPGPRHQVTNRPATLCTQLLLVDSSTPSLTQLLLVDSSTPPLIMMQVEDAGGKQQLIQDYICIRTHQLIYDVICYTKNS